MRMIGWFGWVRALRLRDLRVNRAKAAPLLILVMVFFFWSGVVVSGLELTVTS